MARHYLAVLDYIVICISLLISICIGILAKYYGSQKSSEDYLLAGRNMAKFPVILSIAVTTISPISLIGFPSEVYKYGFQILNSFVLLPVGMVLASSIFIPVYYQCGVSTVSEVWISVNHLSLI